MTAFWKNLQQLAHGQLFNGGYLSPDVARTQAESVIKTEIKRNCSNDTVRRPPHPANRGLPVNRRSAVVRT